MQNLSLDLGKIYNLPKISIHINSKQNFSGKYENISEVLNYDFLNKLFIKYSKYSFEGNEKLITSCYFALSVSCYNSYPNKDAYVNMNDIQFISRNGVFPRTLHMLQHNKNVNSVFPYLLEILRVVCLDKSNIELFFLDERLLKLSRISALCNQLKKNTVIF